MPLAPAPIGVSHRRGVVTMIMCMFSIEPREKSGLPTTEFAVVEAAALKTVRYLPSSAGSGSLIVCITICSWLFGRGWLGH